MIVVEEKSHQYANWQGDKYPLYRKFPEPHKPAAVNRGVKSSSNGQSKDICAFDRPVDMYKARPENSAYLQQISIGRREKEMVTCRIRIIREQLSDCWSEENGHWQELEGIYCAPVAKCNDNAEVSGSQ